MEELQKNTVTIYRDDQLDIADVKAYRELADSVGATSTGINFEKYEGGGNPTEIDPYFAVDDGIQFIISTLTPSTELLGNFEQPIPVRVLEEIKHAQSLGIFQRFKVHYNPRDNDPFVVGYKTSYDFQSRSVIARWGHEQEGWAELAMRAFSICMRKAKTDALIALNNYLDIGVEVNQ